MQELACLVFLHVGDVKYGPVLGNCAVVGNLAAHFRIERCLFKDDNAFHACGQLGAKLLSVHQCQHRAGILQPVIAGEFCRGVVEAQINSCPGQISQRLAGLAGGVFLLCHQLVEAGVIHGHALLPGHLHGKIYREAVGVIKLEGEFTGNGLLAGAFQSIQFLGQDGEALVQGDAETFLFLAHHPVHEFPAGQEFGIGVAHHVHHGAGGLVEEGVGQAEELAETQGPTDEPPQDVAPALIGRQHAVGQQKGHRAAVVGDDAKGRVVLVVDLVGHAGQIGGRLDDGLEQIDVEIGMHALDHGGDTLQAHAGVDARPGQRHALAGFDLVVLHEDEVPDFKEPVAVAGADTAIRAAGHGLAPVVHDFRTGAARAGIAHGPEIVLLAEAVDAVRGQSGHLLPQAEGLVVILVDRGVQTRLVQADHFGEKRPGETDGVFLEVVAEGEVAEHLEEGVMPGGTADVFQVVVLAAHTQAFLGGGGPLVPGLVLAQKDLLELDHAGVGEKQRGVLARDERRRRHYLMAVLSKKLQKLGANLACRHHAFSAST